MGQLVVFNATQAKLELNLFNVNDFALTQDNKIPKNCVITPDFYVCLNSSIYPQS